jgi:hypothetical protein
MAKIFFMKQVIVLSVFLIVYGVAFTQSAGIGTSSPHISAALDISSTNKGMLVPRIALTAANVASPVSAPADALLVYNTTTAGSGGNIVTPGFYYWNTATSRWTAITSGTVSGSVGFGTWGGCGSNNISDYNPVVDTDGAAGDNLGGCVSIDGNFAIVGAYSDDIGSVSDQGSATIYQFDGSNWVFMQKLTDPTGSSNELFGYSVAIYGNYAVVGARNDNGQGSANVFRYNGVAWVLLQKIIDATGATGDGFGHSVSISANYVIVGATGDDVNGNTDAGSASIYQFNGASYVLMLKLTDNSPNPNETFGNSVSLSSNVAAVGISHDDVGVNDSQGSVNLYIFLVGNWSFYQKLTDPTGEAYNYFGSSVSLSGTSLIVGTFSDNINGNSGNGSASIYKYNGIVWELQQKIAEVSGGTSFHFGYSVSLSGDYAIVSTISSAAANGVESNQGSAYIYRRLGNGWARIQIVTDPAGTANDRFGTEVSLDGTTQRFVVGAMGFTNQMGKAVFGKIN